MVTSSSTIIGFLLYYCLNAAHNKNDDKQLISIIMLLVQMSIGIILMLFVICLQIHHIESKRQTIESMPQVRLTFFLIFSFGYFTHCVLYLLKHYQSKVDSQSKHDKDFHEIGIAFNVFALIYIALNLFSAFIHTKFKSTLSLVIDNENDKEKDEKLYQIFNLAICIAIILVDFTIWFDSYLSEWYNIYNFPIISKNSNSTNEVIIPHDIHSSSNEAEQINKFIEDTEHFLNPMMIEFSLMAMQMIIMTFKNKSSTYPNEHTPTQKSRDNDTQKEMCLGDSNKINDHQTKSCSDNGADKKTCCPNIHVPQRCINFGMVLFEVVIPLVSLGGGLGLFVFSFFVVLTDNNDHEHEVPITFYIYNVYQAAMKILMLVFIVISFFIILCPPFHKTETVTEIETVKQKKESEKCETKQKKESKISRFLKSFFKDGYFILLMAVATNIGYSAVNIKALAHESDRFKNAALLDNAISIILAVAQMLVIIILHSSTYIVALKKKKWRFLSLTPQEWVALLCLMLSFFNFGLWASDCIGENQQPVFTEVQFRHFGNETWKINTKLLLPGTIFFRFHCAMDFMEFRYHLYE